MSETFKMEVKVISIGDEQFFGNFKKRELIGLVDDDKYPTEYLFEFPQDKGDLLDKVKKGSTITIHFNIRCRKVESAVGEDRYFTSLSAWRIE